MVQKAFFQNLNECTGCKCCQVACKDKNDMAIGLFLRHATDYEGGEFPNMWAATVSMGCNHCDDPACAKVCPVGAYVKEEEYGLVIQDHDACIGCQSCVNACPYGAPSYDSEEGKTRKCDGCIDWLKNGMQPACVGTCSTRCLQFDDADVISAMDGAVRDISVLPSSDQTSPNFYINPKPDIA